jgi:hypothetical protein
MAIHIDEDNLKNGLMGLVIALVEVIRDVLRIEALKRMEGGSLTEEECERLGKALMEIDVALEKVKEEIVISEAVQSVRDGLDTIVEDVIDRLVNPEKWQDALEEHGNGNKPKTVIGSG